MNTADSRTITKKMAAGGNTEEQGCCSRNKKTLLVSVKRHDRPNFPAIVR